jgi:N-acetylmuramoyl-L-alanine amidase
MPRRRPALSFVLTLGVLAGCGGDDQPTARDTTTTSTSSTTTSTTTTTLAPTTTTAEPLPRPAAGPPRVLITRTGIVVPIVGGEGTGWAVTTPCERRAHVSGGTPVSGATVVLDPGHGGKEMGAVGANGLRESDLNMAVARLAKAGLEAQGASVVLTRTADYRVSLGARAAIAKALRPRVFVSLHHNGAPDGKLAKPGTEAYYQRASGDSKRLAGLLYEEELAAFTRYPGIQWWGNVDAGAKYRTNSRGGDYYGILRQSAGVTTVLSEALFLSSSPAEAALLARPDVQQAEAGAVVRAVRRFLLTRDPGSGFVTPIPRQTPGGPGGGLAGCVDPKLE